jgi:hypothetical protein
MNLALGLIASGAWTEAVEVSETSTDSAMDRFATPAMVGYLSVARGESFTVPWEEGDVPVTDDNAEIGWRSFCLAHQAISNGDTEEALARAMEAAERMFEATGLVDDLVHLWPTAAELAIRTGNHHAVGMLVSMIDDASMRMRVPLGIQAHRQRVAGLLTREEDPAHAANLLREAVEMFATWGARPYQARTEIELGKLLVEQGDIQTGSALVAQGRAVLEELGAVGWLRELDLAQVQA